MKFTPWSVAAIAALVLAASSTVSSNCDLSHGDVFRCSSGRLLGCPLAPHSEGVIAKIQVGPNPNEVYHIHITDETNIDIALRLAAGQQGLPTIPNGLVKPGTEYNEGYDWHIDPASLEFADAAIDQCDGLPSAVRAGSTERFCPWAAKVISISCPSALPSSSDAAAA